MSLFTNLNAIFDALGIPVETGVFGDSFPGEYVTITPLSEVFEMYGDNKPLAETQEARLSLYSKGSYLQRKNQIVKALLESDFTITDRRYIGFETDTKYHHYAIDVAKLYYMEEI